MAEAALAIPSAENFTLMPYFRSDDNGSGRITEVGVDAKLPNGLKVGVGSGQMDVPGAKHDKAQMFIIRAGWDF